MVELYKLGPSAQHIVDLAKLFERRKCNHREAIENEPCIESVVGETNKHRYVVASQSTDLRNKLRKIPAVPLVHINRSVMVLEPRSEATIKAKDQSESASMGVTDSEARALTSSSTPTATEPTHKRKIAKGPNPLSMKKKKPKSEKRKRDSGEPEAKAQKVIANGESQAENSEGGHKRKRRRKHKAICIIRVARDHHTTAWGGLTLLRSLGGVRIIPHVIHLSGTLKKAQLATITHNRTVIARRRANVAAHTSDAYDTYLAKSTKEIEALKD
ncbi:rRNA processing protein, Fcf1 family protein [Rhizoctonia solani]|uniref:rRNA processing protein, Fcf1 family protein n=1 Tax=Rhizoctonia solani TaxID=456999 RepID=A0A8H8NS89_9AGAM|nr:rRNA processing protein, Fcf1 family protein [Rhizoctonia solani]QRW17827.1 rRNA processing protein, Fcf1 family protein [Rhizoctonia solani]